MPPFTPRSAMMRITRSFAVTPFARTPFTSMRRTFGRVRDMVCVARISRICDVPTPKARLPSAPWVEVCESPQAMVMPGCVMPSSGPMMCTMPWCSLDSPKKRMPCSFVLRSMACIICSASPSAKGRRWSSVGTMWSTVAKVRSGNSTESERSFRAWKACGEVTSCTRCRPMKSWSWPEGSTPTLCRSQTLSRRLCLMSFLLRAPR